MQFIRAIALCGIFIGIGAMVSMPFGSQAAAQYEPAAATRTSSSLIQVAENPADRAFKNTLIQSSPWSVTWDIWEYGVTGTHKISFAQAQDGKTFTGRMFDFTSTSSSTPGPLKNIALKENNCIRFVSGRGHEYNYCLTDDGKLQGTMEGTSSRGNDFTADAVAKPTAR